MSIKYFSHRGFFNNKMQYENTLEAFQTSIDKGYGIELDVRITYDNEIVVFHDASLKRLFSLDIKVDSLYYDDLLNQTKHLFHIPTFEEVLNLINGQVPIIVELKPVKKYKILSRKTRDLLLEYEGVFSVESFHPSIVYWFKKHEPKFERGQLLMSPREYDSIILGVFLLSHVTSLFTRPNFYAYRKELGKSKIARFILNSTKKKIVSWTMKPGDELYLNANEIIFENCDKPEELWNVL